MEGRYHAFERAVCDTSSLGAPLNLGRECSLTPRSKVRFVRPVASLAFGVRRRHDGHPAGNFALNQYRERLLTSCGLGRYIAADVEQTLTHAGVIQCLVEGIAEHVANRLRRAF